MILIILFKIIKFKYAVIFLFLQVEEFKKRESRKKAAKEAMLKTALQSQLEGL